MVVRSLKHKRITKKRTKTFNRFESDDFNKLDRSWRRPHGIDNPMRRRFRGQRSVPKIGFGSDRRTRHLLKSGFKKFSITNLKDLEILLTNNRIFAGEIAHNISARKRVQIIKRAVELNVRLTNARGKVKTEEKKAEK
jgi:large subunit ribosomal protein L32e